MPRPIATLRVGPSLALLPGAAVKYSRFEELPVWRAAIDLSLRIFTLTEKPCFSRQGDLRSQLRRSALSVSNNIAEGFERGTTNELLSFLYIARGSAGEVRSMLLFVERLFSHHDFKSEISDLKSLAESCSRQLRGWADSLQNSDITGQRHLNNISRSRYEHRRRSEAFWDELQAIRDRAGTRGTAFGKPVDADSSRLAGDEGDSALA